MRSAHSSGTFVIEPSDAPSPLEGLTIGHWEVGGRLKGGLHAAICTECRALQAVRIDVKDAYLPRCRHAECGARSTHTTPRDAYRRAKYIR